MLQSKHILFVLLILLLSACISQPAAPTALSPTITAAMERTTATLTILPTASQTPATAPSYTPEPAGRVSITQFTIPAWEQPAPAATLIPAPGEKLDGHDIVLRLHNVDKLTGRFDQPTRWLAWGSPAFTIAPDRSLWIADIANRQTRLVHLNPDGALLETLSLDDLIYIIDVASDAEHAWVLGDDPDRMHTLIQFDLGNGSAWKSILPDEFQTISPQGLEESSDWGLTGLSLDEQGVLYLERLGGAEYVQLAFEEDELVFLPAAGYSSAGHIYRFAGGEEWLSKGPMLVDEQPVDVVDPTDDFTIFFQGAASDGSFYMLYRLGDQRYARHYASGGELLGVVRPPQGFRGLNYDSDPYESDTALGTDGNLYALVSLQDQDVVIVRLDFTDKLPPLPSPTPYVEPTVMTPMRPAWEAPPPGTEAEEIARETLIAFFSRLAEHQYVQADELYAGGIDGFEARFAQVARDHPESVKQIREYLTSLASEPEQFWQSACSTLLACLSIGNIAETEQFSESEFRFWVEHTWEDGYKYVTNSCCGGNPAITPFVWLFPYTVSQIDGYFQVLEPPPILE